MRFTVYLDDREAAALRASAEASRRELRDELVVLALKQLRKAESKIQEEGSNEQRVSTQ